MSSENNCSLRHQFRPVEKEAIHDYVELKKEVIKNNMDIAKDQYAFDRTYPNVPAGFSSETKNAEVPYTMNREYIQIRPGMIYNTVRKNCKEEFDRFFKNAGSYTP